MRICSIMVFMLIVQYGQADLYRCSNKQGAIEFKDTPCQQAQQQTQLISSVDNRGLQQKYFQRPKIHKIKPRCVNEICYCATKIVPLKADPKAQLMHSAQQLEPLWQRYEQQLKNYQQYKSYRIKQDIERLACEIVLQQEQFNRHYPLLAQQRADMQSKQAKIKGRAIECDTEPEIQDTDSAHMAAQRVAVWEACKARQNKNYRYRNSRDRYEGSQKTYRRMRQAVDKLKVN